METALLDGSAGGTCTHLRYQAAGMQLLVHSVRATGSSNVITIKKQHLNGGKLKKALALVRAAKECGADAVKIQTYTADTITLDCDNEYFQVEHGTIWDGTTLHRL